MAKFVVVPLQEVAVGGIEAEGCGRLYARLPWPRHSSRGHLSLLVVGTQQQSPANRLLHPSHTRLEARTSSNIQKPEHPRRTSVGHREPELF